MSSNGVTTRFIVVSEDDPVDTPCFVELSAKMDSVGLTDLADEVGVSIDRIDRLIDALKLAKEIATHARENPQ